MDGLATFFWIPNNIESNINEFIALTGQVRHRLQLLFPELGDGDALFLLVCGIGGHPLLVGVLHDLLEVLGLQCVEDVKEVLSRWSFACRIRVRQVMRQLGPVLKRKHKGFLRTLITI